MDGLSDPFSILKIQIPRANIRPAILLLLQIDQESCASYGLGMICSLRHHIVIVGQGVCGKL